MMVTVSSAPGGREPRRYGREACAFAVVKYTLRRPDFSAACGRAASCGRSAGYEGTRGTHGLGKLNDGAPHVHAYEVAVGIRLRGRGRGRHSSNTVSPLHSTER